MLVATEVALGAAALVQREAWEAGSCLPEEAAAWSLAEVALGASHSSAEVEEAASRLGALEGGWGEPGASPS